MVAENALDVAAEKGHWVILQVRALLPPRSCHWGRDSPATMVMSLGMEQFCHHSHVTGQTPLELVRRFWGPLCLCCEPRGTSKVDP